ncbi:MAG TPA: cell division protein FtsL [Treponema sp.]|nr:cell division protein FtsL [Treponema sp.]
MKKYVFLYIAVLTIPMFLCLNAWQSTRYSGLQGEVKRLEEAQGDWVESNKRLIASISLLSSPERIEKIAQTELELSKIKPENVLQINLEGGGR